MKRFAHLGLIALVALSFLVSATLVAGVVRVWGRPALPGLMLAEATRLIARTGARGLDLSCTAPIQGAAASYGFDVYDDGGDGFAYALVDRDAGGGTHLYVNPGRPHLESLVGADQGPLLWFERDGVEYVCRDASTIVRARAILAPVREIGREMGEVGRRMGQRGAAMGRLGGRMGRLGGRMGVLQARAALTDDDAERARLEREAKALRAEMDALSARMPQDRPDDALGRRMSELSRRQRDAQREARAKMRSLIDGVLRERRAERLGVGA